MRSIRPPPAEIFHTFQKALDEFSKCTSLKFPMLLEAVGLAHTYAANCVLQPDGHGAAAQKPIRILLCRLCVASTRVRASDDVGRRSPNY